MAYFGNAKEVSTFTENDQVRYQNARAKGGIELPDGTTTKAVRTQSVQADLILLRSMLRWGTRFKVPGGAPLITSNPLDGGPIPREKNDLRPVATWERFKSTRKAIAELIKESETDSAKRRWFKIDLALVLAEATGRRLGSIRQLKWDDIDLTRKQIRWRAEADKKGKEWLVPIPDSLVSELRTARTQLGAIAGWVFAAEKEVSVPMDRHLFDHWLRVAEERANLPKLKGGLWHAYRRKWATERKDLPIKDVMAAGGWLDVETLLKSYQHVDRDSLLRVMNEPRKFSEAGQ